MTRGEIYATASGDVPFERWLDALADRTTRAKIRVQIDRLSLGNFGKCRFLKGGLGELRISWGPGYRVYFGRPGAYGRDPLVRGRQVYPPARHPQGLGVWGGF